MNIFYSEIFMCDKTANVHVILQSDVAQTDKSNTIISHDPKVSWEVSCCVSRT